MSKLVIIYVVLAIAAITMAFSPSAQFLLDRSSLLDGKPGENKYTAAEPGETEPLVRAYKIAPPLVPHNVTSLVITRSTNDCLDCHLEGEEIDAGHVAAKVPQSHFKNEYTDQYIEGTVTGTRYNCLQCHVPQAEADAR